MLGRHVFLVSMVILGLGSACPVAGQEFDWHPPRFPDGDPYTPCVDAYESEAVDISEEYQWEIDALQKQVNDKYQQLEDRLDPYRYGVEADRAQILANIRALETDLEVVRGERRSQFLAAKERFYDCYATIYDARNKDQPKKDGGPTDDSAFAFVVGDRDDVFLSFVVTGLDGRAEPFAKNMYKAPRSGDPINVTVEMTVKVPERLVSDVAMSAYLNDQREAWNGQVRSESLTKTYTFSLTPDASMGQIAIGAEVRKCGGVCNTKAVSLTLTPPGAEDESKMAGPPPLPPAGPLRAKIEAYMLSEAIEAYQKTDPGASQILSIQRAYGISQQQARDLLGVVVYYQSSPEVQKSIADLNDYLQAGEDIAKATHEISKLALAALAAPAAASKGLGRATLALVGFVAASYSVQSDVLVARGERIGNQQMVRQGKALKEMSTAISTVTYFVGLVGDAQKLQAAVCDGKFVEYMQDLIEGKLKGQAKAIAIEMLKDPQKVAELLQALAVIDAVHRGAWGEAPPQPGMSVPTTTATGMPGPLVIPNANVKTPRVGALSELITCRAPSSKFFADPEIAGRPIDICLDQHGQKCGNDTANLFCELQGFERALGRWLIGNQGMQTIRIGDNSFCTKTQPNGTWDCDALLNVTCLKDSDGADPGSGSLAPPPMERERVLPAGQDRKPVGQSPLGDLGADDVTDILRQ